MRLLNLRIPHVSSFLSKRIKFKDKNWSCFEWIKSSMKPNQYRHRFASAKQSRGFFHDVNKSRPWVPCHATHYVCIFAVYKQKKVIFLQRKAGLLIIQVITHYQTMADLGEQEFNDEAFQKVVKFMSDGYGCALGAKGGPCSKQFSNDTVLFYFNNCLALSSGELDLVILASIKAFTRTETIGEKRNRSPRCSFFF